MEAVIIGLITGVIFGVKSCNEWDDQSIIDYVISSLIFSIVVTPVYLLMFYILK